MEVSVLLLPLFKHFCPLGSCEFRESQLSILAYVFGD